MYVACLPQILIRDGCISICTMPKDVGMPLYLVLVTAPHMSVLGDNTTPIVITVQLDQGKWSGHEFLFSGVGLTPKRLLSRLNPHHWGLCNPELGLALIDSKLQAMTTQSNASCECSGYNTSSIKMVFKKMKKAQGHEKNIKNKNIFKRISNGHGMCTPLSILAINIYKCYEIKKISNEMQIFLQVTKSIF